MGLDCRGCIAGWRAPGCIPARACRPSKPPWLALPTSARTPRPVAQDDDRLTAGDELELVAAIRSKHKARSFAVCPPAAAGRRAGAGGHVASLVLALTNNSLELWDVAEGGAEAAGSGEGAAAAAGASGSTGSAEKAATIDLAGHRSDIRALALASDDSLCLSASNSSVKVGWAGGSGRGVRLCGRACALLFRQSGCCKKHASPAAWPAENRRKACDDHT